MFGTVIVYSQGAHRPAALFPDIGESAIEDLWRQVHSGGTKLLEDRTGQGYDVPSFCQEYQPEGSTEGNAHRLRASASLKIIDSAPSMSHTIRLTA